MKLRLLCVVAALLAFPGAGHAADKNGGASDNGTKKLTIPSVEMGGGSVGVSGTRPDDPNVPGFTDPANVEERRDPFVGLKFNKPLGGK